MINMKDGTNIDLKHIDVLDGVRAMAILIVVWYHFWQESWLAPYAFGISLDWIPRTGFQMVDLIILLSGFCLFLPHARAMVYNEKVPEIKLFYKKRVARVFPSYYFGIFFVLLVFALPLKEYASIKNMFQDVGTHLTFTHTFYKDTYYHSKMIGVLWTLAVEVQFYLIFPFLAAAFRKKPMLTWSGMMLVSVIYNYFILGHKTNENFGLMAVGLPSFLMIYANGMMGAFIVVSMVRNRPNKDKYEGILFSAISLGCIWIYKMMAENLLLSGDRVVGQVKHRFAFSLLFVIFMISLVFASRALRFFFANRVVGFISTISFNLFIWHQFIAMRLKQFHIPFWEGEIPPNISGNTSWQWSYFILAWFVSIAVATILTYGFEKPLSKLIMNIHFNKNKKLKDSGT